jgi:peroxiredoxin
MLAGLGLIIAGLAWAWLGGPRHGRVDRSPGQVVGDFALREAMTGRIHRLSEHRGRVVVIVFVGTSCPVGELYMGRLAELASAYRSRGVDFLAINSNASEPIAEVARHAREAAVPFPVLKDPENTIADQLLAERTCETLVLDGRGRLRYRGAIDDQYGRGTRRDEPVHNFLVDALSDLIEGREVSTKLSQVVGCPIERTAPPRSRNLQTRRTVATRARETTSPPPGSTASEEVTYDRVAPILHARCAPCHRPTQVAPFSLLTYDQARRWRVSIGEVVREGLMPPWHADRRFGRFANDRSLADDERALLLAWVDQGAPRGDAAKAPSPPKFGEIWSIGTPDLVFEMAEPFAVPAEGVVPIYRVHVATNLEEDVYIQAAEAKPGDRSVVHHICIFVEDRANSKTAGPAWQNLLVAYTPGDMPSIFPKGVAKRIPRGASLLFEVHYTPIGKPRTDRSSVGLVLTRVTPQHVALTRGIPQRNLRIPPGEADYVVRSSFAIKDDIRLLSLTPHMHTRGKSFTYSARYPDGRDEVLLSVPRYDFNWQSTYRLLEPKPLPRGTVIHCEAHFDNSAENPSNPDPSRTVTWGEQSWDEMMIGFLDYYPTSP